MLMLNTSFFFTNWLMKWGFCQTDHDVAMGRNANVGNKGPSGLVAAHRAHNDERGGIEDLLAAYVLLHVASLSIDRFGRFRNA